MTTTAQTKKSKVGLKNGRIDWSMMENLSCLANAHFLPLYGRVIGREAGGMTAGQVYERLKQTGYGLKAIRNGRSPITQVALKKYSVKNMTPATAKTLLSQLDSILKITTKK